MNKAERLRIAQIVAPFIRDQHPRFIKAVDSDGRVTRKVTQLELAESIAKRAKIEFSVANEYYWHNRMCGGDGMGPCPKSSHVCEHTVRIAMREHRRPMCRSCASRKASAEMTSEQRKQRSINGKKALAALTPEQRSEASRKANSNKTSEQRNEFIRKGRIALAALSPEQRRENSRKGNASRSLDSRQKTLTAMRAALTPERMSYGGRKFWADKTPVQRSEIAQKRIASMTREQRSEISKKANAARTPEQRSEISRKGRLKYLAKKKIS